MSTISVSTVWVFNGANSMFPSAVFTTRRAAEEWISLYKLSGTLTEYPVDISAYDWAVTNGYFRPTKEHHREAQWIQRFTSIRQEHHHYENGERTAGVDATEQGNTIP
jgi:hypothetical protein